MFGLTSRGHCGESGGQILGRRRFVPFRTGPQALLCAQALLLGVIEWDTRCSRSRGGWWGEGLNTEIGAFVGVGSRQEWWMVTLLQGTPGKWGGDTQPEAQSEVWADQQEGYMET